MDSGTRSECFSLNSTFKWLRVSYLIGLYLNFSVYILEIKIVPTKHWETQLWIKITYTTVTDHWVLVLRLCQVQTLPIPVSELVLIQGLPRVKSAIYGINFLVISYSSPWDPLYLVQRHWIFTWCEHLCLYKWALYIWAVKLDYPNIESLTVSNTESSATLFGYCLFPLLSWWLKEKLHDYCS